MSRPRFTNAELDAIIDAIGFALAGEISGGPFDPGPDLGRTDSAKWKRAAEHNTRRAGSASRKAVEMLANRRAKKGGAP